MTQSPATPSTATFWPDRPGALFWSTLLLVPMTLLLGWYVLWQHEAFGPVAHPLSTDFVSFYAAGRLALDGHPALAYDRAAHAAAEAAATAPGLPYQFFFYPPVYLLLCAPLALLPYLVAFVGFQLASAAAWLVVMRRILWARGWRWGVPVLAFPAVIWTLGLGQNAFLTAALLGGVTLLIDRRPALAGLLLGLLCYKPHLALLAPLALAAGGRWRCFAAAAATVAALVALSLALFGLGTWQDYLTALAGSAQVYDEGGVDLTGLVTPYAAARVLGADSLGAGIAQAAATVLTALAVGWIWRRDPGPALRGMALVSGSLLCVPLGLVYDLLMLTVPIAWLVRESRATGFRAWDKPAIVVCYAMPLISREFGHHFDLPLGPLAPAALLAIALGRTLARPARAIAGSPAQA